MSKEKIGGSMKNIKCKERGITILALVVTIIVLLILAGVAISFTLGEDGILRRAQDAVNKYIDAAENEKNILYNLESDMDNITGDPIPVKSYNLGKYKKAWYCLDFLGIDKLI